MGYYSTANEDTFPTKYSQKEIQDMYKEYSCIKGCEPYYKEDPYSFRTEHPGQITVYLNKDTDESICSDHKAYDDIILAEFLTQIISEPRSLIYTGEDGAKWGYYISPYVLKDIEFVESYRNPRSINHKLDNKSKIVEAIKDEDIR